MPDQPAPERGFGRSSPAFFDRHLVLGGNRRCQGDGNQQAMSAVAEQIKDFQNNRRIRAAKCPHIGGNADHCIETVTKHRCSRMPGVS